LSKKSFENTCTNCGNKFFVNQKCKSDPSNKSKYIRACSEVCTSNLRSNVMKRVRQQGKLDGGNVGIVTKLDKGTLVKMYCYEHRLLADIAKELQVKSTTLAREFDRLCVPKEFYRECPNCQTYYTCKNRSMVDVNSSKFKKYCSRGCSLSSRKSSDTWIEVLMNDFLTANGVDFVTQHQVERYTLDFYIPELNLAIETNGDFWHANPTIYGVSKPIHKIHPRLIEKDNRKLECLQSNGIKVLVVWENDLKTNKNETLYEVLSEIKIAS
jgi:G:T-mismatch repair DNA endonuclease (very short patch repair protein)